VALMLSAKHPLNQSQAAVRSSTQWFSRRILITDASTAYQAVSRVGKQQQFRLRLRFVLLALLLTAHAVPSAQRCPAQPPVHR